MMHRSMDFQQLRSLMIRFYYIVLINRICQTSVLDKTKQFILEQNTLHNNA